VRSKFRTNTPDAPAPFKPTKVIRPGVIPPNRLGVYDGQGRLRGQVGPKATASTAARFHGQLGSKLGKGPDGKQAWLAPNAAADTSSTNAAAKAKLAASLRTAKGSVSK
jgi:hypothetical protein